MEKFIIAVLIGVAIVVLFIAEQKQLCKAKDEAATNAMKANIAEESRDRIYCKWLEALAEIERLEAELRELKNAESEGGENA